METPGEGGTPGVIAPITIGTGTGVNLKDLFGIKTGFVNFTSSAPDVVSIENYYMVGKKPGKTTITANYLSLENDTIDRIYITCEVTIIGFQSDQMAVPAGKNIILIPELPNGYPEGATWSSSNTSVAIVDQHGGVTAVSNGTAVITLQLTDTLYTSCTVTVGNFPNEIAAEPAYMVLGIGETDTLTGAIPRGTAVLGYAFSSGNEAIATVDENGVIKGVSTGRAIVTISVIGNPNVEAACEVVVLPGDYDQSSFQLELRQLETQYNLLVRGHKIFDGGYLGDDGQWVQPIDLSGVMEGLAGVYAKLLGANSGDLPFTEKFTRSAYIAEQIMSQLVKEKHSGTMLGDFEKNAKILLKDLKLILSAAGLYEDAVDALIWHSGIITNAGGEIDKRFLTMETYNDWFKDALRTDANGWVVRDKNGKPISMRPDYVKPFKSGYDIAKTIYEIADKFVSYMNVDQSKLKTIANALRQTGNEDLVSTAALLDLVSTTRGLIGYLTSIYGFELFEKEVIGVLKKGGWAVIDKIPVIGPTLSAMKVSIDFATSFNKVVLNLDEIQKKAFQTTYAIDAAKAYLPTFEAAYTQYRLNPVNAENVKALSDAVQAFSELVAMETEACGSYVSAYASATATKLINWIKSWFGGSGLGDISSFDYCASMYRKGMKERLDNIKSLALLN